MIGGQSGNRTGFVEQVGSAVENLKAGDQVLVPFNIACGLCHFCKQELFGNCHEANPQATAVGGIFGYSHTAGGFDGGQAQYACVPYAAFGPTIIPDWMDPDDAVLLTDVVPTGYQAAEMGGIQKGDTVLVFGAGPVGIMAARCAWLFGAGRVIVIDHVDYRATTLFTLFSCDPPTIIRANGSGLPSKARTSKSFSRSSISGVPRCSEPQARPNGSAARSVAWRFGGASPTEPTGCC